MNSHNNTGIRTLIEKREPFASGLNFGNVGSYEKLIGRIFFSIDPNAPANQTITDLDNAPRNRNGFVEYDTDFCILKPVDLTRGNRRLIYDVINRGNKGVLEYFNDAKRNHEPSQIEDAGNGFIMRRGYTIVWSAWEGDILPGDDRMTIRLPIATENGREINGIVRSEFIAHESGIKSYPLSGENYTLSYETISLDTALSKFTYRKKESDQRKPIRPDEWQFAKLEDGRITPSPKYCYLPTGFRPGWIYELIYTAKNPLVLGLGYLGVRDLISFLLHAEIDSNGTSNPLKQNNIGIEKAYASGRSQSGRFLRAFVYQGFNEDLQGKQVFDAIFPQVAVGGGIFLDYRFARPTYYPRQHENHLYPQDQFPFAYCISSDPLTGKTDGILKRPNTDPFVIHIMSSSEYWQRRGSLVHTDSFGNDLSQSEKVRIYLFTSSPHSPNPNNIPQRGAYEHLSNPLCTTPLLRALLDALDAWVTNSTPPPDSQIPTHANGNLVTAETVKARFPVLPGVICLEEQNRLYLLDRGPYFDRGIISKEPPEEDKSKEYQVYVPQIDADGNEISGIRSPHIQVPRATFTGWNLWSKKMLEKTMYGSIGSYIQFSRSMDERHHNKDSRLSIEERYSNKAHYIRLIALATQQLINQRLLLEEDADKYVELAMKDTDIWALRST
jgi:hypothetical protein